MTEVFCQKLNQRANSAAFLHPVIRYFDEENAEQNFHFGDSLLGRWDLNHAAGGAVASYHYDFQKWLNEVVGLDFNIPDLAENSKKFRLFSGKLDGCICPSEYFGHSLFFSKNYFEAN